MRLQKAGCFQFIFIEQTLLFFLPLIQGIALGYKISPFQGFERISMNPFSGYDIRLVDENIKPNQKCAKAHYFKNILASEHHAEAWCLILPINFRGFGTVSADSRLQL